MNPAPERGGKEQNQLIGWLWLACSAATGCAVVAAIGAGLKAIGLGDVPIVGPLAGLLLALPWWFYKRGQRHFAQDARGVLAGDDRPPVLYLRSFTLEKDLGEEEQALAAVLATVGPFVAVGDPRDAIPPLGASRLYVQGYSWQDTVAELVRRARLVVILAGPGHEDALGWELKLCRNLLRPSQLLVLVPKDPAGYGAFRALAQAADVELPSYPPTPELEISGTILGLVAFENDWRAKLVVRHYDALDAVSLLSYAECTLRSEFQDLLGPAGIVVGPEDDSLARSWRDHWRIAVVLTIVLVLYWLVTSIYGHSHIGEQSTPRLPHAGLDQNYQNS